MKREFDIFKTFQARGFTIFNHKEKFDCNVKIHETGKAIYYASKYDAEAAKQWLLRQLYKAADLQEKYDELWRKREEYSAEYDRLTDQMYEIDEMIHIIKGVKIC